MKGLLGVIQPPGAEAFGELATPAIWGTIIAFALIASAESLFSAAAVDRLHDGPRTEYNKEMIAQGAGTYPDGFRYRGIVRTPDDRAPEQWIRQFLI